MSKLPKVTLDRTPPPPAEPPPLDLAQRQVVAHSAGPLLVLAGPGTGKTTTIVESVVERLTGSAPLNPDRVLVLTFARKAAKTLRERVALRLPTMQAPWVATFHSFAFAVVRARAMRDENFRTAGVAKGALRLLSAPEEDARVKKLMEITNESNAQVWPAEWQRAIKTTGFAGEVRELLTRARALGVSPQRLADLGQAHDLPVWQSVAALAQEVDRIFDLEGVTDYADLIHWATDTANSNVWRNSLGLDFDAIYVDEYQDVDPSQVGLLRALFAGQTLVVVGDPDQAIYRFRGADVSAIQRFPKEFANARGEPAPVIALQSVRRFGPEVLTSAQSILPPITSGGLPVDVLRKHRQLECEGPTSGVSEVEVRLYESNDAEVSAVADWLREARVEGGGKPSIQWRDMAVIVRTNSEVQRMQAGLLRLGLPAVVTPDEIPLVRHPATKPLLTALEVAHKMADGASSDGETARYLLTGPIGSLDTATLRRAARVLREAYREAGLPTPSGDDACASALSDPRNLLDVNDPAVEKLRILGAHLATVAAMIKANCSIAEALWALWAASPSTQEAARYQVEDSRRFNHMSYRDQLHAQAFGLGQDAERANREIDAVISLFEMANRDDWRESGPRGIKPFLADLKSQQFPVESWLESPAASNGVRVLTAHRAKGLEWSCVAVVGVNEGVWPPMGVRGTLLGTERLSDSGVDQPEQVESMLHEERRLLYVAMTRAKEKLLVTAVADESADGASPSRFLKTITPTPTKALASASQTKDPREFVAYLRRCLHQDLDQQAAEALVALASARSAEGRELFPAANPANWWGLSRLEPAPDPVRPTAEPVRISGSDIESMRECKLRWFLSKQVRAQSTRTDALTVGSVIHAFARALLTDELVADTEVLKERLREIWAQLFPNQTWVERSEEKALEEVVERLVDWHLAERGRVAKAGEAGFKQTIEVGDDKATLVGRVDRIEVEVADPTQVHIIDFKTSKRPPSNEKARTNAQLGTYRMATQLGAFDEVVPGGVDAGAELVQLRKDSKGQALVQVADSIDTGWFTELLLDSIKAIRKEDFAATECSHCFFCEYQTLCPIKAPGQRVLG